MLEVLREDFVESKIRLYYLMVEFARYDFGRWSRVIIFNVTFCRLENIEKQLIKCFLNSKVQNNLLIYSFCKSYFEKIVWVSFCLQKIISQ